MASKKVDIKDDPDYDLFGLVEMYTDTDYKKIDYQFGDKQVSVYALLAASTDYDLTGQIVWQAAKVFSEWLCFENTGDQILTGKRVLELGSGPGLGGFLAAHWASQVVLSDYQDLVMDLMKHNIKECNPRPDTCEMLVTKLDWCEDDNLNVPLINKNGEEVGSMTTYDFDVIIGTDVVYWPMIIKPLVRTLDSLFTRNPKLVFYVCYIERHSMTHRSLLEELQLSNFQVLEIGQNQTKPINRDSYIYKVTRSQIKE